LKYTRGARAVKLGWSWRGKPHLNVAEIYRNWLSGRNGAAPSRRV